MRHTILVSLCFLMFLSGCTKTRIVPIEQLTGQNYYDAQANITQEQSNPQATQEVITTVLCERFAAPTGYVRETGVDFGSFLQKLPLVPPNQAPKQYDGNYAGMDKTAAVIDLPVSSSNYENAGDSVIRLLATYLYNRAEYSKIAFTIGDNFSFDFDSWRNGKILERVNDTLSWKDGGDISDGSDNFQKYLDTLFTYATVRTLRADLKSKDAEAPMEIGDILIDEEGTSCVLVVDLAKDTQGNVIYLLAGGSSLSQQMSVLKNPGQDSPWYTHAPSLTTPNAVFSTQYRYTMQFSE